MSLAINKSTRMENVRCKVDDHGVIQLNPQRKPAHHHHGFSAKSSFSQTVKWKLDQFVDWLFDPT